MLLVYMHLAGSFVNHLCFVFVMLSCLFIAALWSPAGKGLASWLSCLLGFIAFLSLVDLGQLWYLIESIPDLCILTYFNFYVCVCIS